MSSRSSTVILIVASLSGLPEAEAAMLLIVMGCNRSSTSQNVCNLSRQAFLAVLKSENAGQFYVRSLSESPFQGPSCFKPRSHKHIFWRAAC